MSVRVHLRAFLMTCLEYKTTNYVTVLTDLDLSFSCRAVTLAVSSNLTCIICGWTLTDFWVNAAINPSCILFFFYRFAAKEILRSLVILYWYLSDLKKHVSTHTHTNTNTNTHRYTYTHTHNTHRCTHIHTHTIHTRIYTHTKYTHTDTHTIHTHTDTHKDTHINTHKHTQYTHRYTQTHTTMSQ